VVAEPRGKEPSKLARKQTAGVIVFKFRPSSHSTDYVLIATYGDEREASKAVRRLKAELRRLQKIEREDLNKYPFDWAAGDAYFYRDKHKAVFQVYSSEVPEPIKRLMEENAEEVTVREGQQALRIRVELPKGVSMETAPLLLDADEVNALKLLVKVAGKPKVKRVKGSEVWEWCHIGELSYVEALNELFYGDDFAFKLPCNWRVRIMGKTLE